MPFSFENQMPTKSDVTRATNLLIHLGLLNACEQNRCLALLENDFPFSQTLAVCDSLHLHVKVENADALNHENFVNAGCRVDYAKLGFVKFLHPGDVNLIFSSIVVSEDELIESATSRRNRPFLDHIGIDLRRESEGVKAAFDSIPAVADSVGWSRAAQGEGESGVHCCHVEVAAKHWVYPGDDWPEPRIPLEFAYGKLKVNDANGGCDLRPMSPAKRASLGHETPSCKG